MVYNRGFCDGFYFGEPQGATSRRQEHLFEKVFIGDVIRFYKRLNVAEIRLRHGVLKKGDELLFIGKSLPVRQARVDEIQDNHQFVDQALKGQRIGVKVPFPVKANEKVFIWKER